MVGLALSPRVGKAAKAHVYVAYAYDADPEPDQLLRRMKIRRYTYARGARRLTGPMNLITGMPASNDHNAGRLVLGPDRKLYYTIGDQGNNQFDNYCTPIRAQDLPTASRSPTETGSVPGQDPAAQHRRHDPGRQPDSAASAASLHLRPPQPAGDRVRPGGLLYSVEHGPKSDDELKSSAPGRNYGWPYVPATRTTRPTSTTTGRLGGCPLPGSDLRQLRDPAVVPRQQESEWSSPDSSSRSGPSSPCPPTTSTTRAAVTRRSSAGRRSGRRASTSTPPRRAGVGELAAHHDPQARHRLPPQAQRRRPVDRRRLVPTGRPSTATAISRWIPTAGRSTSPPISAASPARRPADADTRGPRRDPALPLPRQVSRPARAQPPLRRRRAAQPWQLSPVADDPARERPGCRPGSSGGCGLRDEPALSADAGRPRLLDPAAQGPGAPRAWRRRGRAATSSRQRSDSQVAPPASCAVSASMTSSSLKPMDCSSRT